MNAIEKSDLFSCLTEHEIDSYIRPLCTLRMAGRDSQLLTPQQKAEHFAVVCSGQVQVVHRFDDGSTCIVDQFGPGEAVALDLVFTHSRISPYHVVAVTEVQLAWFSADLFEKLPMETALKLSRRALTMISQNMIRREYRLAILAQKGLRQRIMTYLTMQASRRRRRTFTIPFDREALASFLCVNRSALSHELSLLQQEGKISFHKNQFTVY